MAARDNMARLFLHLEGEIGSPVAFRAVRRAGTTTAAAVYAMSKPFIYVNSLSEVRAKFVGMLNLLGRADGYGVTKLDEMTYEVRKGDVWHLVRVVSPEVAMFSDITTFIDEQMPDLTRFLGERTIVYLDGPARAE